MVILFSLVSIVIIGKIPPTPMLHVTCCISCIPSKDVQKLGAKWQFACWYFDQRSYSQWMKCSSHVTRRFCVQSPVCSNKKLSFSFLRMASRWRRVCVFFYILQLSFCLQFTRTGRFVSISYNTIGLRYTISRRFSHQFRYFYSINNVFRGLWGGFCSGIWITSNDDMWRYNW